MNDGFHVKLLKPYVESKLEWPGRQQHHRPAPVLVDGESEWEVERVTGKKVEMERKKVTKVVEETVKPSGGRVLRKRPPRKVTVEEEVPVVWYRLRWKGYDEETWQKESDCHCSELIEEYELLQRQMSEESEVASGKRTTPAVELGVATVIEWWLTDKTTTTRRGQPTVRCSYANAEYVVSETSRGQQQPAAVAAA
jgi:hypothetical protein